MTAKSPDAPGHLQPLDGIRGLAILLVAFHHIPTNSPLEPRSLPETAVKWLGMRLWSGVDLFFVLSGFLITGILLHSKARADRSAYFKNFYARRVLRIVPLYYLFLVVFALVLPALNAKDGARLDAVLAQWWAWLHLANFQIFVQGPAYDAHYIGHVWSLAIEEQFYLVWPVVVLGLGLKPLRVFLVALLVGAALVRLGLYPTARTIFEVRVFTPAHIDVLAVGALLATFHFEGLSPAGLRRWVLVALGVAAALLAAGVIARDKRLWQVVLEVSFNAAVFSALTAAALLPASRVSGTLGSSRVLGAFGRYSYGYYLWHAPLYELVGVPLSTWVFGATGSILAAWLVEAVVMVPLCFVVAKLSFDLYERRFLELKKYFETKKREPAAAPLPADGYIAPRS